MCQVPDIVLQDGESGTDDIDEYELMAACPEFGTDSSGLEELNFDAALGWLQGGSGNWISNWLCLYICSGCKDRKLLRVVDHITGR